MDDQSLATVLADLQSRMAFQDDTIQTLSDVIAEQQQQIWKKRWGCTGKNCWN